MTWLALVAQAAALAPEGLGDITVTEVMSDPGAVSPLFGEWFELHNNTDGPMDFNGVLVERDDGQSIVISGAPSVAARDYLVLGVSDDTALNGGVEVDVPYNFVDFNLSAVDDTLTVSYGGTVLDIVSWDSTWPDRTDEALQVSVHVEGLEWANDLEVNWCAASDCIPGCDLRGTPGAANDYCGAPGIDNDEDGYTEVDGDCDDSDADIHPGAPDAADPDDDGDCDGVRNDWETDDDGDGQSEIEGDCDDADPATYQGAPERVDDDIDNDCDGCTDETDTDLDGWSGAGDEGVCDNADCNDEDRTINPDARERPYDGVDQNCNGSADECDQDGDGYPADSTHGAGGCDGLDCDDANPDIHPGAPENSANGVDDDCDGQVDIPDRDGDGYTTEDGDCMDVGPGQGVEATQVALSASAHPGAVEICGDLVDNDCNGFIDDLATCTHDWTGAATRGGGLCGTGAAGALLGAAGGALAALPRRQRRGRIGVAQ